MIIRFYIMLSSRYKILYYLSGRYHDVEEIVCKNMRDIEFTVSARTCHRCQSFSCGLAADGPVKIVPLLFPLLAAALHPTPPPPNPAPSLVTSLVELKRKLRTNWPKEVILYLTNLRRTWTNKEHGWRGRRKKMDVLDE